MRKEETPRQGSPAFCIKKKKKKKHEQCVLTGCFRLYCDSPLLGRFLSSKHCFEALGRRRQTGRHSTRAGSITCQFYFYLFLPIHDRVHLGQQQSPMAMADGPLGPSNTAFGSLTVGSTQAIIRNIRLRITGAVPRDRQPQSATIGCAAETLPAPVV